MLSLLRPLIILFSKVLSFFFPAILFTASLLYSVNYLSIIAKPHQNSFTSVSFLMFAILLLSVAFSGAVNTIIYRRSMPLFESITMLVVAVFVYSLKNKYIASMNLLLVTSASFLLLALIVRNYQVMFPFGIIGRFLQILFPKAFLTLPKESFASRVGRIRDEVAQKEIKGVNIISKEDKKEAKREINRNASAFEELCAKYYRSLGYDAWTTTELKKMGKIPNKAGDAGVDVVAINRKTKEKIIVQAKYYSKPVDADAVRQVFTALGIYKANKAVVISNNKFNESAILHAKENGVELIPGLAFQKKLKAAGL